MAKDKTDSTAQATDNTNLVTRLFEMIEKGEHPFVAGTAYVTPQDVFTAFPAEALAVRPDLAPIESSVSGEEQALAPEKTEVEPGTEEEK
jgi:hypothetical protein